MDKIDGQPLGKKQGKRGNRGIGLGNGESAVSVRIVYKRCETTGKEYEEIE